MPFPSYTPAWACLALCLVSESRSQSIPEEIEQALSSVATMHLRLRCDIDSEVHGPRQEVFRRWSIGETMVRARSQIYAIAGERFHFTQLRQEMDPLPLEDIMRREIAFDGADVRYSSGDDVVVLHSVHSLASKYGNKQSLFLTDYFDAARIDLPCASTRLGSLPESAVLRALYEGASITRERTEHGTQWRVEEILASGNKRLTWLSPEHNYAVVRWEEHRSGAMVRRVQNSRFFRVGSIFLPGQVDIAVHGWHTVPEDISAVPLVTRRIRVAEFTDKPRAADLRFGPRRPGSRVRDNRYDGYDSGLDGHIVYHVAVPPDELKRKFAAARVEAKAPNGLDLVTWAALHLLGLVVWAALMQLRSIQRT